MTAGRGPWRSPAPRYAGGGDSGWSWPLAAPDSDPDAGGARPPADPHGAPEGRPAGGPAAPKGRILIVEDDAPSLRALQILFGRAGWTVVVATTVAEAMRALADDPPDSIVLDLMLPDGDGAAVLRHVRDQRLPIRVNVTTGTNDPARLAQVYDLRPQSVMAKPIDIGELLRRA